jgi:hypothetical protein
VSCQYCGAGAHKYLPSFFPVVIRLLDASQEGPDADDDDDQLVLRQACVYGITQTCRHAPEFMDQVAVPYEVRVELYI